METAREKAIKLIKSLPSDISLEEIVEQLRFIDSKEIKSISAEVASDPELKKMIAESREAYKANKVLNTEKFLEDILNRFNSNESD
ncbi:MAG: hypothetical protein KGZ63_05710 [Clostridiales bacterium]|jgi:hypothetical protein|nr:hypothetical protein [Clostridiales bacterium]